MANDPLHWSIAPQERQAGCGFGRPSRQAVLVVILALLSGLAGCHHQSRGQLVRKAIESAAAAARNRDAGALDNVLSSDFVTPDNSFSRTRLLGTLRLMRLRGERLRVLLGPVGLEPRGSRMVAKFTVTLGGGGGLIPAHLGVYRVKTAWRRIHGEWRCYRASWKRAL